MARISGLQVEQSGGKFSGRGRVINCFTECRLPDQKEGSEQAPTKKLEWVLEVQPTDDNGNPLMDQPKFIRAALGSKWFNPTATHPFHYGVGYAKDRNDPNPSLVGIEPGARGNTIYVPQDGMGRPKGTAFDKLFASLSNHIPQAAVDAMQCEEFIGMLADFKTVEAAMGDRKNADGTPATWSWTEVERVIAMPNCPDWPGNNGAARPQAPAQTAPAAAPVRPQTPPVRPATVPAAAHAAPVAQAQTTGSHDTVAICNLLAAAIGQGALTSGTQYDAATLVSTVTPKIMAVPTIGGATMPERQKNAMAFRNAVTDPNFWATLLSQASGLTGGRAMDAGDGTLFVM